MIMAENRQSAVDRYREGITVRNFFSKLTTQQSMMLYGGILLGIAGIIATVIYLNRPQMSVLFRDVDDRDLGKIIDKLKEKKVQYELDEKNHAVLVREEALHETRIALASEGIPEKSTVGYELFDNNALGMSDFMQKLNYRRGLEGELARTIQSIDEVSKARVHIVIPEKQLFEKDQKPATASVVINLKSGRRVSKSNVEGVQHLVASSVEGMQVDAVTIIDQRGQLLSEKPRDNSTMAGMSATQYELKQKVDDYLGAKAQSMLAQVLGPDNTSIRVDAELDFTQRTKEIQDYDPERQVVLSEESNKEASRSSDSLNYPTVASQNDRDRKITNYAITKSIEKITNGSGAIKRLSVAATINGIYKVVDNNGEQKYEYSPRSEQEMEQLRQLIRNAVGFDPSRNDQVTVVNIPFDTSTQQEIPKKLFGVLPMTLQEFLERILLVAGMIISIFILRKVIASPQVRRRIETVFAPSDLDKQRIELAKSAAERQQLLLKGLSDETGLLSLPDSESLDDIAERAKSRLDVKGDSESTEEQLLKQEMKRRVQSYFNERPEEASMIIKLVLKQQTTPEVTRRGGRR
jgi:flagellar M-ring protein FliF